MLRIHNTSQASKSHLKFCSSLIFRINQEKMPIFTFRLAINTMILNTIPHTYARKQTNAHRQS